MSPPHVPIPETPTNAPPGSHPAASELEAAAPAWRALDAGAAHPTQQYIWMRHAAASFSDGLPLTVLTAGPPGHPRAFALLQAPSDREEAFSLPGARELGEPMDLACADTAALDALAAILTRLDRPILLDRVPADSPAVAALERAFRPPGVLVRRPAPPYPAVSLDASWLEPESHLNPRRRSDLRRARRRAEALGPVRFDLAPPTPAELPRRLEQALEVEAAGWKRDEGTALLVDPARGRFFRGYAADACRQGSLRLNLMYLGDRPVAMQLAVEVGRRLWLLKIGYHESYARCSPGNLLLLESLRDSAARGLASVELLGRSEPWTQLWATEERRCLSLLAYPGTLGGLSSLARDGASWALRRIRRAAR